MAEFWMLKCMSSGKGNSRNFVEWFPELSGQIQGFVKGGAYFSCRSLKQVSGAHSLPEAVELLYF